MTFLSERSRQDERLHSTLCPHASLHPNRSRGTIVPMTFDDFLKHACPPLDLEWRKYRKARRRISERIRELGLGSWSDYLELLRRDQEEAFRFPYRMRVMMTRFFRDRECWDDLAELLPGLVPQASKTLRAWSAGCCGGEEPHSLAILWLDRMASRFPECSLDILATDIDDDSLYRARTAWYQHQSLREADRRLLVEWFEREGDGFRPLPEVRRMVRFRKHNFMLESPPGAFDLVLCRYLPFTYYSGVRLDTAIEILASVLKTGGLLMIGRKEAMPASGLRFFAPAGKTGALWRRE